MIEPGRQYVRNPAATAITGGGHAIFLMPGDRVHHATDVNPSLASKEWSALAVPTSGADLTARLAESPPVLRQLVESLIAGAFILRGAPGEFAATVDGELTSQRPCGHLVLGVTGAVQAVFAPQLVQRLAREFAQRLDVILTVSAQHFVQPRALAVFGAGVWSDPFESREGLPAPHAHLAGAAELVLIMPATADTLFRLAHGAASDLLGLVVCATEAPVVVVPSMHPVMWRHSAVQRNVELLRNDGVFVVEPGPAVSLADGDGLEPGGAGLGAGSANLIGALTGVLGLSRPRSLRPSPHR